MTDDQSPFADTPDGVGLTVAGYLLCVPRGLKMGPARDGINAAVSAIVSAARKEEREAMKERCAKVAESHRDEDCTHPVGIHALTRVAAAIRALGE